MKKCLIICCLITTCSLQLNAQQKPLTTMFMTNPYAINPALASTYDSYQIISNNRFQWVGFNDAPITNTLTFFGPTRKYPMGYGGIISYDVTGPVSIGSIHGSYAYYYTVNEDIKISMGLNLGILQYRLDMSKVELPEEDDPLNMNGTKTLYKPDASIGIFLWTWTYNVGFIATQLLNNKLPFGDDPSKRSKLKTHYFLTAGYKHFINREWQVEPTIILKKVTPSPYQLDINVRGWYRNMIWFGLSYRTQEALSVLVGYIHKSKSTANDSNIQIGYAYDIVLNPIGAHNYGSHELVLSYKFARIRD